MNINLLKSLRFVIIFVLFANLQSSAMMFTGKVVTDTVMEYNIPFELEGHKIIVKIGINNSSKKYNLIFDTGGLTMINEKTAAELNLKKGMAIPTWSDTLTAYSSMVDTISLDGAKVSNFILFVFDFFKDNDVSGIEGLLGSDFAIFYKTTINYNQKILTLSLDTASSVADSTSHIMNFEKHRMIGTPMVNCTINDSVNSRGMIDTGSPSAFVFPLRMVDSLKAADALTHLIEAEGVIARWPISKSDKNYLGRIKKLRIGDISVYNMPVLFADVFDILIGKEFLEKFTTTINYPKNEIVFAPNRDIVFKTDIFSAGLAISKNSEGRFIVKGFWKDSPADISGVKVSDEILEVNSRKIEELSLFEINSILSDDDIVEIRLIVKQNDRTKEILIKKDFLFSE